MEIAIFFAYAFFLKMRVGVDLIRVGRHIMAQLSSHFFGITIAS